MAEWIYGKNSIKQRLKEKKSILKLYFLEGQKDKEIYELAVRQNIPLDYLSKREMDKLASGGKHQGVMAEIEAYRYWSIAEITDSIPDGKLPLLLMLDGLEDPHNLGAILRSCDAVGVDGVIIGKHRSVSLNATVAKVSTGAIETVKVALVTNLNQTIAELKEKGYWVCGSAADEATDYRLADYKVPLLMVVGSEGSGISPLVKKNCDYLVKLPMIGRISSLNASVATAVLLYEVYNQRFPV